MDEKADTSFSMRDFYYVLFRHKVSIVVLFFVTLLTVVVGICLWPETYQAKACIFVKVGRENISLPTVSPVSQQQVVAPLGLSKEDINSEIEILTSRSIVEKVVKKLGTDFLFPKDTRPKTFVRRIKYIAKQIVNNVKNFIYEILYKIDFKKKLSTYDQAVLALQARLSAKLIRFSNVIEVQFRWFSPVIAEEVLDTIMDCYLAHHSEAHRTSGGYEFFQKQVDLLGKRLKASEDNLELLKENEKISSYEDQIRLLLGQVNNFRASLKMTETELAEAGTRIEELRKKMSLLRTSITMGFSTVYKEAEKELLLEEVRAKALSAKKQKLQQHIESYLKDIEKLRLSEMKLRRLKRQIRMDETDYELYSIKLEEARISDVLDAERILNVRVIQPAAASLKPVRPRKLLTTGVGLMLSFIFGIGFAFLSEYLDHSIRSPEHVNMYLDLPLLASIREGNK